MIREDYQKFNKHFTIKDTPVKGGTNSTKTYKINLKRNNKTRKMKRQQLVIQ